MNPARALVAIGFAALPGIAAAHPHIFVDTTFEAVFDDRGRITALKVGWTYDEMTTLLVIEDGGHDTDGDGLISPKELEGLKGFDMDWGTEFLGDLYAEQDGEPLEINPGPQDWTTAWADGKLSSTHLRRFAAPVDPAAGTVVIKPYDPSYYTAYAIVGDTVTTGRKDCRAEVFVPDLDAAQKQMLDALKEYMPGDDMTNVQFPMAGANFSEELRITCGP